jgi:hypothetical protein
MNIQGDFGTAIAIEYAGMHGDSLSPCSAHKSQMTVAGIDHVGAAQYLA